MKFDCVFLVTLATLVFDVQASLSPLISSTNSSSSEPTISEDIVDFSTHRRKLEVLDPSLIPSRRQWDCNYQMKNCCAGPGRCANAICDGYCGSMSIQEIALYYGAYVSQGLVRRMVPLNDKVGAKDIILDVKILDIAKTLRLLGFDNLSEKYGTPSGWNGVKSFTYWTKQHLQKSASPIIMGVIFYKSNEIAYDHIVTATRGIRNGLLFNDHYSKKKKKIVYASYPNYANGQRCQYAYCYSKYMNGVAVHTPSAIVNSASDRSRLVRLKVISSKANNFMLDTFKEPNWTCGSVTPSVLTLQAFAAYPALLDNSKIWYVAVTFQGTTSQEIRNVPGGSQSLFGGAPKECYRLPTVSGSVQITVPSDQAVYTRLVSDGCP